MSELVPMNMRIEKDLKAVLQGQADERELNLSDHVRNILGKLETLPEPVEEAIKLFSKGLNLSYSHVINCAVLAMVARLETENLIFGRPLLNPLIVELGGDGWDGVYRFFVRKYRDALYGDEASMASHEKYLAAQRKDLIERTKKFKKKKDKK
jgi:hypothetical protein